MFIFIIECPSVWDTSPRPLGMLLGKSERENAADNKGAGTAYG